MGDVVGDMGRGASARAADGADARLRLGGEGWATWLGRRAMRR